AEWSLAPVVTLRAGGDVERTRAAIAGTYPRGSSSSPGSPERLFAFERSDLRVGPYVEADWRPSAVTRLISGVRADRSDLTRAWTVDPRLSFAYQPRPLLTLTAAWGAYHQIPDPLLYDSTVGIPDLPSMRATQTVLGLQLGEGALLAR